MGLLGSLFRTTIAKKAWMAVTGLVLVVFVAGHCFGNLKLYQGRYAEGPHAGAWKIDVYGEGLRELGAPVFGHGQFLWIVRIGLLAAVGIHAWAAAALTLQSRAARPVRYSVRSTVAADYAARTMRWGGVLLALFVVYHLADLTWGNANPAYVPGRVHDNLVASFSRPGIVAFYVAANLALGFHLFHGFWSFFRSLGCANSRFESWRRGSALALSILITAGNVSFPAAVLLGAVR